MSQVTVSGRTFLVLSKPGTPTTVSEQCTGNCGRAGRHRWHFIGEARTKDEAIATLEAAYGDKQAAS